jgi:hypothetical protein
MPSGSAPEVDEVSVAKGHVGVPSESPDVVVRSLIGQHLCIDANRVTGDAAFSIAATSIV